MILAVAIILGLIGLAVHVFWLGSIVLMSVLLGLLAADVKGRRGGGVVSELVAEAKDMAGDITNAGAAEPEAPQAGFPVAAAASPVR